MKDTIQMINPLKCLMEDEIECTNVHNVNQRRMWYKIYILNKLKQQQEKTKQVRFSNNNEVKTIEARDNSLCNEAAKCGSLSLLKHFMN